MTLDQLFEGPQLSLLSCPALNELRRDRRKLSVEHKKIKT